MTRPLTARQQVRKEPRFAVRTIRNGRVKILGRWFAPRRDDCPLKSGRFAFGFYGRDYGSVSVWGTEEMRRRINATGEEFDRLWRDFCKLATKDGYFLWEWWDAVA